jgi:hypothetical protein
MTSDRSAVWEACQRMTTFSANTRVSPALLALYNVGLWGNSMNDQPMQGDGEQRTDYDTSDPEVPIVLHVPTRPNDVHSQHKQSRAEHYVGIVLYWARRFFGYIWREALWIRVSGLSLLPLSWLSPRRSMPFTPAANGARSINNCRNCIPPPKLRRARQKLLRLNWNLLNALG